MEDNNIILKDERAEVTIPMTDYKTLKIFEENFPTDRMLRPYGYYYYPEFMSKDEAMNYLQTHINDLITEKNKLSAEIERLNNVSKKKRRFFNFKF